MSVSDGGSNCTQDVSASRRLDFGDVPVRIECVLSDCAEPTFSSESLRYKADESDRAVSKPRSASSPLTSLGTLRTEPRVDSKPHSTIGNSLGRA